MSNKKLTVGNESYDYPITGTNNYGEGATDWAEAITDVASEFFGPGDITTTEAGLNGIDNGNGTSTGLVSGLTFDTAFVQRIKVEGILTREYTVASSLPQEVESFTIEGAYNGSVFNITCEYAGDDTEIELFVDGGQFKFTSLNKANTLQLSIKYKASTIIDDEAV